MEKMPYRRKRGREDAAFEENIVSEFDVMKSMLGERYAKQSEQSVKKGKEEKNVEIGAAADEKRKIAIAMKKGGGSGKEAPVVVLGVVGSDHRNNMVSGKTRRGPRFQELGGINMVLEDLMMEVIMPLCHPELRKKLGARPKAGILLHGPPGCGKTKLAYAIANETGLPFYKISATEVVAGVSGASEESIRDLFNKAYRTAPSIVFIDEIDAIASKRENLQREMECRIVTQLMTCMDESQQILTAIDSDFGLEASEKITNRMSSYILVIGATNRPDAVDQALRRPGRFDIEIALGVPDENARAEILSVLTRNLRIEGKFDRFKIARFTPGFVGADLEALVSKAWYLAIRRIIDKRPQLRENVDWWRHPWSPEEIENISVTMFDFEEATKLVQPSTRREGFSSIPNIKWEDVGGLDSLRKEFNRYIIQRIKHPEDYEELGVDMEVGFMLYGPPGCGKTLIVKALANEADANFIHIKGPEILRKYVGESEQEVKAIFSRARTCSPCIIFFDEVDALTPKRGTKGAWVVERAFNQLLVELDGADKRHGVYVIGATNRLEVIDPAVLRPSRFGMLFYVPLPSADERGLILKALAHKKPVSPDFDYNAFTSREACKNLTGADLAALINEAASSWSSVKLKSYGSSCTKVKAESDATSDKHKGFVLDPQDFSFTEDHDYTEYDDYDDEYDYGLGAFENDNNLNLAAQFDELDLPPGVEATIPWLQCDASKMLISKPNLIIEDAIDLKFKAFKQFDTVRDYSDHYFIRPELLKITPVGKKPGKDWAKRIQHEWKVLEKDLPETIYIRIYEDRMDLLRALIVGPAGTPYHDGLFFFDIYFPPTYPLVPPIVHYHSGGLRLNPNLYACGKVCLSLLNTWSGHGCEKWNPTNSTMLQVLVSIQALVLNSKPYFNEPGYANSANTPHGETRSLAYNENTFILSCKTMLYSLRRPPRHFEDFIAGHFRNHGRKILMACRAYIQGAQVGCVVGNGVQDVDQGDKSSSSAFKKTLSTLFEQLLVEFTVKGADCDIFLVEKVKNGAAVAKGGAAASSNGHY